MSAHYEFKLPRNPFRDWNPSLYSFASWYSRSNCLETLSGIETFRLGNLTLLMVGFKLPRNPFRDWNNKHLPHKQNSLRFKLPRNPFRDWNATEAEKRKIVVSFKLPRNPFRDWNWLTSPNLNVDAPSSNCLETLSGIETTYWRILRECFPWQFKLPRNPFRDWNKVKGKFYLEILTFKLPRNPFRDWNICPVDWLHFLFRFKLPRNPFRDWNPFMW